MMKHIIFLLLFSSTLTAQTKLRQIERSATKWHVPAAWDSIPGVTGHAMKYIDLETLMDTVGIQQFGIDSLDYRNDSLLIWVGGGYYFAIIPQGLSGSGDDGSVAYWHQDTIAGDTAHFWDRTNKRLGLNTKTPSSLLHVKKNEYALPVAEFDNPGTNGQTVLIKHGASSDARYPLTIQTPAATNYFDARGYLGLGVSPSYPLHVKNTTGISRFENTNTNGDAGFDLYHSNKWWRIAMNAEGGTTNNVHFRDVTGSRYPITLQSSNGYVGILNLTPARELHVTGRVRVSTLDSDLTPPTTAGTTKMVITDEDGDLSFANIPTIPVDSTVVTQGYGITVTESPTNTYNVKSDTSKMATVWDVSQVDQSATNELQTLSHSSTTTTHTTTLSNSGGSLILKEGSNVTLTTSGNEVTIASTASGGGIDSTIIIGGYGITSVESPLNTFNIVADTTQMQRRIVLSTNGTSGPATLTGSLNLNIPQYGNGDITGITTTAPITGSTTSGNATLGLSYDPTYMGIDANNPPRLYPLYNVATWNANSFRGRSISVTAPTDGQVYSYNAAGNNWIPTTPSSGSGTLTYANATGNLTLTPGNTVTIPLVSTSSRGLAPTLSNSSTQFLNGVGGWTTPTGNASMTISNTSDPTINTSTAGGATGIQFVGSGGVTVSGNTNTKVVTITGSVGGGVTGSGTNTQVAFWSGTPTATLSGASAFVWDNSNSRLILGAPTTPSRTLDVNGAVRFRSLIADVNNSTGNSGQYLTSNGVGAWFWSDNPIQSHGSISNTSATPTAITTTATRINFTSSIINGGVTSDITTGNEKLTVGANGNYEISFNSILTGAANRVVTFQINKNNSVTDYAIVQTKPANDNQTVSSSWIVTLNANDYIDIRVFYGTATGTGTDINYSYPFLNIKRLK